MSASKVVFLSLSLSVATAQAQFDLNSAAKMVGDGAKQKVEKEVNARLTNEARKNQCAFKTGSDELMKGCDAKLKKLASALVDAKKTLDAAGLQNYKFEVSGHTDSTGDAAANKALSAKRAAVMVKELTARGISPSEITSVGMGSERPLVTPDDTPAKKAKNRRYEVQVRL